MSCVDGVATGAEADLVPIAFVGPDGSCEDVLRHCWNVRFEDVDPVRRVGSFKGQRHFAGWWWFATTGRHVGFESWVERDQVLLLDFDRSVIGLSSQPFWLTLDCGDGPRRHVPDYFARLADGSGLVIDVRPDERVKPADAAVFAATAAACSAVGWQYRRVGAADPVLAANLRWLAGYRHPRCLDPQISQRIRAEIRGTVSVEEVVAATGDRLGVLPTLFHLMWTGEFMADLCAAPLTPSTPLVTRRAAA